MLGDSNKVEDPLKENEKQCSNCNRIYVPISTLFDVGVCDVRCNWQRCKLRAGTDFYEWEAALIGEKYPNLYNSGIPMRRFYFTKRLNLISQVKHLYSHSKVVFVEFEKAPSKEMVLYQPVLKEQREVTIIDPQVKIWTNFSLKEQANSLYNLNQLILRINEEKEEKEEEEKAYQLYLKNNQVVLHKISILGTPSVKHSSFNYIRDKIASNMLYIDLLIANEKVRNKIKLQEKVFFYVINLDAEIGLVNENLKFSELYEMFGYLFKTRFKLNGVNLNPIKHKNHDKVFRNKLTKQNEIKIYVESFSKIVMCLTENVSPRHFKKTLIVQILLEIFDLNPDDLNPYFFCMLNDHFNPSVIKNGNFNKDLIVKFLDPFIDEALEDLAFQQKVLNDGWNLNLEPRLGFEPEDFLNWRFKF
jgi:hypothetical protein